MIDNLSYTYNNNRISKVEDSGTALGFDNQASVTTEYSYDTNKSRLYNPLNYPKWF